MTRASRTDRRWAALSIKLFVAPVALGVAGLGFGFYLYAGVSTAVALMVFAALLALWTWFVFVVLRDDVVRSGRHPAGWTILVYFTGVFGLIAWDATRRRLT
jgi:hypothetical protein